MFYERADEVSVWCALQEFCQEGLFTYTQNENIAIKLFLPVDWSVKQTISDNIVIAGQNVKRQELAVGNNTHVLGLTDVLLAKYQITKIDLGKTCKISAGIHFY